MFLNYFDHYFYQSEVNNTQQTTVNHHSQFLDMLNLAVLVPPFCLYSPSVSCQQVTGRDFWPGRGRKKKKVKHTVNFKHQRKILEESEFQILNCNSFPPQTSSLKIKPAQSGSQNPSCDVRSQLKRLSFLRLSIHKRAKTANYLQKLSGEQF